MNQIIRLLKFHFSQPLTDIVPKPQLKSMPAKLSNRIVKQPLLCQALTDIVPKQIIEEQVC